MTDDAKGCTASDCAEHADTGEAFSEAVCPESVPEAALADPGFANAADADLASIIAAWPTLPADVRAGIVAAVQGKLNPDE